MEKSRTLKTGMKLSYKANFPFSKKQKSLHRYRAVIGIGGNVGDVKRRFDKLFNFLQKSIFVEVIATSPLLKNPPFGYLEQEDFQNGIIEVATSLHAQQFLYFLLRVEKKFGRKRSFADAPRTLDLDLLFFDYQTIQNRDLTLPHPHWRERQSVVIPLLHLGVL
jgi:2-amino-4-hydroxy-6-hydroxymethyldihydropteridine diphosphokinase